MAIRATFERRGTEIPDGIPLALEPGFMSAAERAVQWRAFVRRTRLVNTPDVERLADDLGGFLEPPLSAAREGSIFRVHWSGRKCREPKCPITDYAFVATRNSSTNRQQLNVEMVYISGTLCEAKRKQSAFKSFL